MLIVKIRMLGGQRGLSNESGKDAFLSSRRCLGLGSKRAWAASRWRCIEI